MKITKGFRMQAELAQRELGVEILPFRDIGSKHRRIYMRTPDGIELFAPLVWDTSNPRTMNNWLSQLRHRIEQRRKSLQARKRSANTARK